jgi:hypothetical protein
MHGFVCVWTGFAFVCVCVASTRGV